MNLCTGGAFTVRVFVLVSHVLLASCNPRQRLAVNFLGLLFRWKADKPSERNKKKEGRIDGGRSEKGRVGSVRQT